MEPIIKAENLTKTYRLSKIDVPALRGVGFQIQRGEFVAIVGPSGCGKSTLLHILGGITTPTSGLVCVDGNNFSEMSDSDRTRFRRHKIGFVFQRFNLLPTLTAHGNIAIAQHISGDGFNPHRFDKIVETLNIKDKLQQKPFTLSGGQQQRVAIARALICDPKIVLADEPTGNLDSENAQMVLDMMQELNREFEQTLVVITHNPEVAARAERVIQIRDGHLVED